MARHTLGMIISPAAVKQKSTQEALKLMADKYRLQIFLLARRDFAVSRPTLHNHGIAETPATGQWTPEDAWVEGPSKK